MNFAVSSLCKGINMSLNMMEALKNAGFDMAENDVFVPYENFSDLRMPFGDTTHNRDQEIYSDYCRRIIDSDNYIRRTAESLTKDEIDKKTPEIKKSFYKDFLLDNSDKVKLINKGNIERKYNGMLHGIHSDYMESEFKRDTEYGFVDVVYLFIFNTQTMQIELKFDRTNFGHYQKNLHEKWEKFKLKECGGPYADRISDELKFKFVREVLVPVSEFIPFYVEDFDGCRISHRAYRDMFGFHEEVTSPVYGINIKKHGDVMKRLEGWMAAGGYIKDENIYLICEDRCNNSFYLLRYDFDKNS